MSTCSESYTPSAVGFGTHEITARYDGDSGHSGSLATTQLGVGPAHTSSPSTPGSSPVFLGPRPLVIHGRFVTLRVRCRPGGKSCDGTVTLSDRGLLLGRGHFHVTAGKVKAIRLKVSGAALGKLRGHPSIHVTVNIVARGQTGRAATTSAGDTLVLRTGSRG